MAMIGLVRGETDGPSVAATVQVDLGCLGIRHAALRWGGVTELAELLADYGEAGSTSWTGCSPALVARIIDAGADLGWINGAAESPRFRLVQRLFDPLEADDGGPPVETGDPLDGRPMYIAHAQDDGAAIVEHLARVFGRGGFTIAGGPTLPTGRALPFVPAPPAP